MKNRLFIGFAAVLFAAITVFNLNLSQEESAGDITLAGVELVAGANYEVGPWGTNWKSYTTQCTYTTTTGFDYIFVYTESVTYTVTKNVCGSGAGWCLAAAGC